MQMSYHCGEVGFELLMTCLAVSSIFFILGDKFIYRALMDLQLCR